jgi:4-amino-4-deoxy-L-arabinose transferase-like glycosyltransferase
LGQDRSSNPGSIQQFILMKKIKLELGLVLLLAFFLYFWQIQKNQYFSYDQARDFLIIKKIIVDHKFTLIGPSLGIADGAYLPPWYYYLIAPALFISDFHLWGPDVLSAILGILGVFVFYLLARKMFGEKIAFLSSLFYVGNPFMIQAARHIRNPHLLPLFLLAFAYFSRAFLEDKRSSNLLLSSFFLGIALSMHITAIVFLPVLFYLFFIQIKRKKYLVIFVSALIPAGLFTPLLFFDLRHGFGISKAVASFFNHDGGMSLFNKTLRLTSFFYKIPLVLFSGNFQKQLLSLRSMPFFSLEQIGFGGISIIDFTKLVVSFIFFCFLLVFAYKGLREKRKPIKNNFKFILIFIFLGLCVSFLLPKNYSYFYYFYNLFPFIFLLLSGCLFLFF